MEEPWPSNSLSSLHIDETQQNRPNLTDPKTAVSMNLLFGYGWCFLQPESIRSDDGSRSNLTRSNPCTPVHTVTVLRYLLSDGYRMFDKQDDGIFSVIRYKPLVVNVGQRPNFVIAGIQYPSTMISLYKKMRIKRCIPKITTRGGLGSSTT